MTSRTYRIVALSLPFVLLLVLVSTGGWRLHGDHVERVSHTAAGAAAVSGDATPVVAPADQAAFVRHLSPSVPWPVCAALLALCILPAMASILVRSDGRRRRDAVFAPAGDRG